VLRGVFSATGRAYVIGVTGAPGAGKSTLVDGLVRLARDESIPAAVLAVDPSSPFSRGAILGDRIRMQAHAGDSGVFIRSMSARGQLGGLARATRNAVHVLDAAGYALIIVETVGVGQSELDIAGAADTTLVVVTPHMGDTVQTLKAGILEIADVFALNKSDQDGARRTLRALGEMLHMGQARPWSVPIVETQGLEGTGLGDLWAALGRHRAYLEQSGELDRRRAARLHSEVVDLVHHGLRNDVLAGLMAGAQSEAVLRAVLAREIDPDSGAQAILSGLTRAAPSETPLPGVCS